MFLISFRLVFLQKFRLFLPVLPEFKKSNVMKQPRRHDLLHLRLGASAPPCEKLSKKRHVNGMCVQT